MTVHFHQHLMRHLGALSLLAASGVAPAAALADIPAALADIPADMLDDATADVMDDVNTTDADRLALLRLVSTDARPNVRACAADGLGRLFRADDREVEALLKTLANDPSSEVSVAAAAALADHLSQLAPLSQMAVIADWATSEDLGPRVALAQSLSSRRAVFLADMALEALAFDDHPRVRREAVRTIRSRYWEAPDTYRAVLEARIHDVDRRTRSAARAGLFGSVSRDV